ncbi:hypothetical protein ACJRO7_031673 [Eucalyptus globulus]|uniref:Uncharacterized protein n=1 Tax=Eucalyptus globulus TaxID=34317 RepID=A0ABD3JKA8_EUCGL
MAETVLFSLATDILKGLAIEMVKPGSSFAFREIQLLCGAKDELQSLKDTVETIQSVLLDAEKQQWHNDQVRTWLKRLKAVFYEVQDLLDDVATEDLRRNVTSGNKISKEVRVFFSKSNQLVNCLKVANKIQELRKKLDRIKSDNKFHFERHLSEATVAIGRRRTAHSFAREEEIIGREDNKNEIIAHLFDSSSIESVTVVSIVGMGGLGKTALAKLVYNDDKVKSYFELRMWACQGDTEIFDEELVIKEILKSAQDPGMRNLQDIENKSKEQLQQLLRNVLEGKKYLLILDDLWNEDRLRWLDFRSLRMGGSCGSKILITTRSRLVEQATDAKSASHVLQGLSNDKSWDLFKKMAFGDGEESLDLKLEEIGRDIVKKCAGVPLALKTIGSVLYNKNKNEWLYLKEHELSKINKLEHGGIIEVLKLSYDHLPLGLKHCFAYCALFPKDYVYDKQTMIQLWMAHGFIESLDGNDDLEQIGDSYVSDLLYRSFLEVEETDDSIGEVKMFKMHDLMHDLALKVTGDECKMVNLNEGGRYGRIRHASFASSSLQELIPLLEMANLRTILYLKSRKSVSNLFPNQYHGIFSKCKHCQVLGLHYADFSIPPSLGSQLKHLRFLDISENQSIKSLPDSITNLVNLQTLKLSGCKKLTTLPSDLRKLINLRHLLIDECDSLNHMPHGLSQLSSLRTLSQFIVQKIDHKLPSSVGRIDELGSLNKLAGSITIRRLEFLQLSPSKGYLREKQHLCSLKLEWSREQQDDKSESNELIMWENLRPHPNLAHLTITSCMGRSPPSWLSSIRNLVDLVLWECRGWKYLPPLSELPSLKKLTLVGLDALELVQEIGDLEQSNTTRSFFPSLEGLFLHYCGNLKGWWGKGQLGGANQDHWEYDSQSSFPKLSSLEISYCPHLNSEPLFPWIENLSLVGVSVKIMEQQLMAFQNRPSEAAVSSTFVPLSKLKKLLFVSGEDLEHSMLEILLRFLDSLKSMSLYYCFKLKSLSRSMQYLSALQHLDICGCEELDLSSHDDEHGTQWRFLTKLRDLRIRQLSKLVALPDGIQQVTTLQFLHISRCENLTSLPEWMGNFSLLQELHLFACPGLTCLPDGMRHLTSLKKLTIVQCPALEERCQRERTLSCLSFELDV